MKRTCEMTMRVLGVGLCLALAACSGGGGGNGGGGGPQPSPLLVEIAADGVPGALWAFPGITPPGCGSGVPLNGRITFTFNGKVDAASVPGPGPADGAVRVSLPGGVAPAVGSFAIEDDPALTPGNGRRLVFTPSPPANPNSGGYITPATYQIEVKGAGSPGPLITIGGTPLAAGALTCFDPCLLVPGASLSACVADLVPGPPLIIETWPPMGEIPPAAIDPTALTAGSPLNPVATTDNTVTLRLSEPLVPENLDLANVRLVRVTGGAQVPGQVVFYQAGTAEAGPDTSRIDYVASTTLLSGVVYELQLSPLVRDFGDHPVEQVQGDPTAKLRFQTQVIPSCAQPAIVETFDDDTNLAAMTRPSALTWGGGALQAGFPLELTGDGSYGPMIFAANAVLDTGMAPVPGYSEGTYNATDLHIPLGVDVRVTGPYPLHIRCTGSVTIQGSLDGSAGMSAFVPLGSPDQGPRGGGFDNGQTLGLPVVSGGAPGPGGGRGGNASQGGAVRTERGEDGFGPSVNGQPDPGAAPDDTYGGGEGGDSGFFPPQVTGELGGLGGAGGSAWESGGAGQPLDNTMGCAPITTSPQPLAQPTGATPPFTGPVSALAAGSGGGGGGDHLDTAGVQADDQGGGGGGAGGGIRISALGPISIGSGAVIETQGATGGSGSLFAGAGAGGSGGMIWLQTFDQITIDSASFLLVTGGAEKMPCTRFHSGAGGFGLIQLEDDDGLINLGFGTTPPASGTNVFALDSPFGSEVVSQVESIFFDTGYGDPDYTGATLATDPAVSLGNVPGGSVEILYQGAHESLSNPGTPDLAALSPQVSGASIDQLDGYRFVRFQITVSYTAPPTSTINDIFPAVQEISIDYATPIGCP